MDRSNRPYVILDPTHEAFTRNTARANEKSVAPPPARWQDLRVGLLANGKQNSRELLDELLAELSRRPGVSVASSFSVVKNSESIPPKPEDFQRLVADADLVLTAIGD
jgi:hypothetical protein